MRKTVQKMMCAFLFVATLSTCGLVAFASADVPYGDKGASIALFGTSATAWIKKCSCNPVNNYLAAWIRIQYREGDNYKWNPTNGYYFDAQSNATEARRKVSGSRIQHAEGYHYARCGKGSEKQYTFSVNK